MFNYFIVFQLIDLRTKVIDMNSIKINDLEDSKLSVEEKNSRCKLATLYRIINHFNWTQTVYNHISLRCSENREHYYVNTFGLLYEEITASNLIKVSLEIKETKNRIIWCSFFFLALVNHEYMSILKQLH